MTWARSPSMSLLDQGTLRQTFAQDGELGLLLRRLECCLRSLLTLPSEPGLRDGKVLTRLVRGVKFDKDGHRPKCYTYVKTPQHVANEWWPSDWHADHCLSEKVEGQCSLNVNLAIIWIVVTCNIIKLFAMVIVAFSGTTD